MDKMLEKIMDCMGPKRGGTKALAEYLGISPNSITNWKNGHSKSYRNYIKQIAVYFDKPVEYFTGKSLENKKSSGDYVSIIPPGFQPVPKLVPVPVVGRIACGTPILAEENIEGTICIPERWRADFVLVCNGDSMEPKICEGDLVAIRKQPEVENGEIAAVRIGEEATLKRVYWHDGFLELRAENPTYGSKILAGEDAETVTIEGKAIGLCRDL